MPTTLEAKEAKRQLAQSICDLIREYFIFEDMKDE